LPSRDCKQVCLALVVSREGMLIGYEVFAGNPERGKVRSPQMRQQVGRARARRLYVGTAAEVLSLGDGQTYISSGLLPYRESSARITRSPIVLVDTSRSNDKPSRMDANHREWWCPARVTPHCSVHPRPLAPPDTRALSTNVQSAVQASRSVRMTMPMSASLGIYARKGAR